MSEILLTMLWSFGAAANLVEWEHTRRSESLGWAVGYATGLALFLLITYVRLP